MVEHSSFDKLVGTELGNYRLERLLEQNEQGAVFLVSKRDPAGDRSIVKATYLLRILAVPTELTSEARIVYLGRFQQQANQIAALQHPHILPLLDYGNHQGMPYLVSPNLPVTSLSARLTQKGPLDVLTASRYLDQTAAALAYAHEHGVLHRNLTTDCIFLKGDDNLFVADFGVMRMLELSRSDTQSLTALYGNSASSAPAPEQLLGKPVDTYTDVYALGAVLYRMLTAHRVFRGKGRDDIVQQHLQAPVPSVSKWRSDLPANIDGVIARALAKKPAQRFRQPGELADAYHQVVAPHDTTRKPIAGAAPAPTASPQQRSADLEPAARRPVAMRPSPAAASDRQPSISRRRALAIIGAGSGAAVGIAAVALFASHYLVGNTSPTGTSSVSKPPASAPPAQGNTPPPAQGGHVLARTSDVPLNSAKTFPLANSQNPGLLIHLPNNQFVAFDSTCTHAACPVSYNQKDKLLECPCHGAVFDPARNAAVVQGPAPRPLTKIPITVQPNGTITTG
jgi:eukaryotic-like serine/threonine-protein kinase